MSGSKHLINNVVLPVPGKLKRRRSEIPGEKNVLKSIIFHPYPCWITAAESDLIIVIRPIGPFICMPVRSCRSAQAGKGITLHKHSSSIFYKTVKISISQINSLQILGARHLKPQDRPLHSNPGGKRKGTSNANHILNAPLSAAVQTDLRVAPD